MPRARAACGTYAAYRRHLREKEPVDDACRDAARREKVERRDAVEEQQHTMTMGRLSLIRNEPEDDANSHPAADSAPEAPSLAVQAELEANLALVKAAMAVVALRDPARLAPLSKRHSELVNELQAAGAAAKTEEDPFDAFLGAGAGLPTSPSRKSS